jgi:HK97 family phage major capsid protein
MYVSDECTAFAAGAKLGVFGDISQYQVVDFGTPEMIRDPYTKAGQGQVRFIGWELMDAALPLAEAVVTCPVHA